MKISSHHINVHTSIDDNWTDADLEIISDQIDEKVEMFVEALQTEYSQFIITHID